MAKRPANDEGPRVKLMIEVKKKSHLQRLLYPRDEMGRGYPAQEHQRRAVTIGPKNNLFAQKLWQWVASTYIFKRAYPDTPSCSIALATTVPSPASSHRLYARTHLAQRSYCLPFILSIPMRLIVTCDDSGSAKEVVCTPGTDTSKQDKPQPISITQVFVEPKASPASRIVYSTLYQQRYAVCCRLDASISVYDLEDDEKKLVCHREYAELKGSKPVSLHVFAGFDALVMGLDTGKAALVMFHKNALEEECKVVELPGGKPIDALEACPSQPGVFAYGGKENDLRIVKVFEAGKKIKLLKSVEVLFAAKNVKNDHLDLRVPIWITKIRFLPAKDSFKLITATRYGQLRIYDTNHGRKPAHDYQVCTNPIITLNFAGTNFDEVIISDNKNMVARHSLVSIDKKAFKTNSATAGDIVKPVPRLLGKYQEGGNTGAIFGVLCFKDTFVATGGLDRYLRVYNLESRELVSKVYVGSQIADILFLEEEEEEESEDEVDEEEENNALWDELESSRPAKKQKQT